jgi:uncharacterized membrane protein YhhN
MRRSHITAAIVLAVLSTAAEVADLRAATYALKPLATLALAALVLHTGAASRYRAWIVAGLIASLAGDILLMLPQGLFVPGLIAFLVAHLCYITAFALDGAGLRASWIPALPVYAVASLVLVRLWPSLGAMRLLVLCYVAVISTMSWQAIARWQVRRTPLALYAAVGSLFFLASDSALAMRRFVAPFSGATLVVLATYYAAQFGIALSVPDESRTA